MSKNTSLSVANAAPTAVAVQPSIPLVPRLANTSAFFYNTTKIKKRTRQQLGGWKKKNGGEI
ncbi:MAG: hypothetical protein ACK4GN_18695 [Runella sp.]